MNLELYLFSLFTLLSSATNTLNPFSPNFTDPYHEDTVTINEKVILFALNLPFNCFGYEGYRKMSGTDYNAGHNYAAAAAVAVRDINVNEPLLKGYTLKYYWNTSISDTCCIEKKAVKEQIIQMQQGVEGFVGYKCSCLTLAKNAAAFNMPLISDVSCNLLDLFFI